ncbi:hypothetical protein Tco_0538153, partial [Tanacetum coccineum]
MAEQDSPPPTITAMKIPIIKKGEYDIWSMRMRQYICHTDHNLWDIIIDGDLQEEAAPAGEQSSPPAPKTAKQLTAKRNQERAAIKSRFGGNDESKKMQRNVLKHQFENFTTAPNESLDKAYDRFQKLISQLEVHAALVSKEDINQKFLRSLPPSWSQIALIMRNKPDIDQTDIDDLYNNLRVYKDEMKRSSSSTSNSQNLAFLSFENTSSTMEELLGADEIEQDDLEELDNRMAGGLVSKVMEKSITPANDRFSKADGYHVVPPPITGNFLTPRADISFAGLDEYAIRKKIIESKTTELNTNTSKSKTSETVGKTNEVNIEKPKSVYESVVPKPKINRDKVIIEDWYSDDEDDVSEVNTVSPVKTNETQTVKTQVDKIGQISQKEGIGFKKIKACFVCKIWDNAKRVNQQKSSNNLKYPQAIRTFVPSGVLTRTGLVNPDRPNGKRAVHTVSTARHISTARPISIARLVSTARQFAPKIVQTSSVIRPIYLRMDNVSPRASYSPIKRSYYTRPVSRPKDLKQDVKISGVKNMTTSGTRVVVSTNKGKVDNVLKKSRWVWRPKGNYMDHESKEKGSFI